MTLTPETLPAPDAPASSTTNTIGLVALIFAGIGFVLGVIPATSGLAWVLLIPSIVLAIIGLTRKARKKGTSVAALILGIVAWIISIVVFLVSAAVGISGAIDSANDAPVASEPSEVVEEGDVESPSEPAAAGVGDVVTSRDGVSLTVNAVTCGLPSAGADYLLEAAKGQFCEVAFTLVNGTADSLSISSYDFLAFIGDAEYETNSTANKFGDELFTTDLNPGLTTTGVVYFDIPVGVALDTVQYSGLLSFDEKLVVNAS
jgi:hypothetical protein